ncbi:universal stress protein [Alisedimentitalea sp. MJ-SS2]|uniref:universal stress protein n=1 Tax=Aliisedimentitalea sp. MJ-SS2 TaxID=3049795 RepID=UPI00290FE25E|nr:universal stress protein [Alisedimentitalea sp. MJ-SS2]MDU8925880.1 universal stress protein [Alisedimentitalea sp. MJ-SS2]
MYNNILVPIAADHDPQTEEALAVARALSAEGAKITALTVVEAMPGYILSQLPEGQMDKTRHEVEEGLKEDFAAADDVTIKVIEGHSARTILDYAEEHGADCIVIASHRPDITDYFLGSTAARVVRHAQCAVHVLR